MPLIRTPESRFDHLTEYPYAPHYVEIDNARVHYVDEGEGPVVLCLHGEPTWSYLYRKMIPILSSENRVIAPDLIGFGKSDKFTETSEYSIQVHLDVLSRFIDTLNLQDITIVVQDWGGLLGLRTVAEFPARFSRLVILNTFLPTGREKPSAAFVAWQQFAKRMPRLPIGLIIRMGTVLPVSKDVIRGYEAPFPDERYKAGARIFPALVPLSPEMAGAVEMRQTRAFLRKWDKPALVLFSDKDPILGGAGGFFRRLIPTAKEQPEIVIHDAGHFLQEDKGEEIADHIVAFLRRTE